MLDGKVLWVFALEGFEILFDLAHLCFHIAVRDDGFGADDAFLSVVEAEEQDWEFGLEGDVVEAVLPFRGGLARALRCNAETKGVALAGDGCQLVRHASVLATLYGYAAHAAEDGAKRPHEPLFLHQELTAEAFGTAIELSHEKVPVAGVWCQGDDVLPWQRHADLGLPTHESIEYETKKSLHRG